MHLAHILNVELEKCFIEKVEFELDPKVQMRLDLWRYRGNFLAKGKHDKGQGSEESKGQWGMSLNEDWDARKGIIGVQLWKVGAKS